MSPLRLPTLALLAAVALAAVPGEGAAQVIDGEIVQPGSGPPPAVAEATITERLGYQVAPQTTFRDSDGRTVRVGDYLGQGKPVVLAFVYHNCPMLCSLILDGYAAALKETALVPGEDFIPLAVSFDQREGPARALQAKQKYLAETNRPELAAHWHFLTGTEQDIERLADEVGFGFAWDPQTSQFAHTAALIVLSPDGTVARYLYGVSYPERDFRLALVEAGRGEVGSTLDRFILTCFRYDAERRTYTPVVMNVMKIGGVLLLVGLAALLVPLWRRERMRQAARAVPATDLT